MLLSILRQCCYCQSQRLKKRRRNKGEPFHAQHHSVKQAMHLNIASGLHILKIDFYLEHSFSIFTSCIFFPVTLAKVKE